MKNGFTLIELLVAIAIAAILAVVALPSYADYITRGRIVDGTATLSTMQVRMEQFFQDNRTYVGAPDCANNTTASQFFNFSCAAAPAVSASGYVLQAVGKGGMTGFTFTVNQANSRATAAVPSGWTTPTPNNCWVTRRGGQC
ncbi:type IV pilus assembly protein PilE [Noviherbaspirillum humi]|uniref:Type IV pilus assembly protein PilE n=1 Tax=Noviherbaspirillum humi TaxID=1688639 RepID=A0A239LIR9_9BURK|nr:type IV pilin protein [Noviherbaspirillum humi]SNT29733.1 type IV pilus assembly protein PilE [Noviherbaspirillum humi]